MTFGGNDLYPSLQEKAAALCFSLIANHPFLDGDKRVAHAAMETFLMLNGSELSATVDEQERLMLSLAAASSRVMSSSHGSAQEWSSHREGRANTHWIGPRA